MINIGISSPDIFLSFKQILKGKKIYNIALLKPVPYEKVYISPFNSPIWLKYGKCPFYKKEHFGNRSVMEKIFSLQEYYNYDFPDTFHEYHDAFYYKDSKYEYKSVLKRYTTETRLERIKRLYAMGLKLPNFISPNIAFDIKDNAQTALFHCDNFQFDSNHILNLKKQINQLQSDLQNSNFKIEAVFPPLTKVQIEFDIEMDWIDYQRPEEPEIDDMKFWYALGREEERKMDEETDGFWRAD